MFVFNLVKRFTFVVYYYVYIGGANDYGGANNYICSPEGANNYITFAAMAVPQLGGATYVVYCCVYIGGANDYIHSHGGWVKSARILTGQHVVVLVAMAGRIPFPSVPQLQRMNVGITSIVLSILVRLKPYFQLGLASLRSNGVQDGPARRHGCQQMDATFHLPEAYFSSKTLDDACKGIKRQLQFADGVLQQSGFTGSLLTHDAEIHRHTQSRTTGNQQVPFFLFDRSEIKHNSTQPAYQFTKDRKGLIEKVYEAATSLVKVIATIAVVKVIATITHLLKELICNDPLILCLGCSQKAKEQKAREVLAAEGSASRKPSVHIYFEKRKDRFNSKRNAESSTCASLDAQLSQSQNHRKFSLGKCKI
ncbi:hypothetical protein Tco_0872190 [Tanacetum coccineum]